jgi:two-component system response regulator HydG
MKEPSRQEPVILVVDDEPEVLDSLSMIFKSGGFRVLAAEDGRRALQLFSAELVPVVVCDNSLPDTQGIDLLGEFRAVVPEVQMIMVTGRGTINLAVAAMKAGVFDFIAKPPDPDHLIQLVLRARELFDALTERESLREQVARMTGQGLIGRHPTMVGLLRLVDMVAPTDSTVLIEGESGTGKELVARLIHRRSRRSGGPFVPVDCGAIPEGLVESELFGHEKGAFTGATNAKPGKFERASRGTLFLDEIANLPVSSQAKILRALQESVVERVGGQRPVPVNIRLVAATNTPLQPAVKEKSFREDLYYRLNIVRLRIPPLRERKSDIVHLAHHFMEKHRERIGSTARGISKEALRSLMDHQWPGNVRELENAVEHALIMARSVEINPHDLPQMEEPAGSVSALGEAERDLLIKAIRESGGNKYRAAKMLGIPRSSLYSKLRKFGLDDV